MKEQVGDHWGVRWIEELAQDARFSLRGLRRSPSLVATVVGTIALGLALNTTVFTIFNAYVLKPLPIREPETLFETFWGDRQGHSTNRITWRQYQDLAAIPQLRETFAYGIAITRSGQQPLFVSFLTGNAFQVLGAVPALGRLFGPTDAEPPNGWPVAVLSHAAWKAKFGGDSGIVGRSIVVHGISLTVIGVAASSFIGIGSVPPDLWAPITYLSRMQNQADLFAPGGPPLLRAVVRVRPELSERQARAALARWATRETLNLPDSLRWSRVELTAVGNALPLTPETIAIFAPAVIAFGLVLLIACVNVANVMLARGIARQREIGVRLALGAGRARLVRQLFTESVLLAIPAAAIGFWLSRLTLDVGVRLMMASFPPDIAGMMRVMPLAPDLRVFGFILLAALASAVVFGLAPAIQATRPNIVQASRGDFDTDFRPGRARGALIVAEVATCSLLLIVTGLLLRGAQSAARIDPVVRIRGIVQLSIGDSDRVETLARLRAQPEVQAVAASSRAVLDGIFPTIAVRATESSPVVRAYSIFVDSGFFPVLDIRLSRGRDFTAAEARNHEAVAIVNEAAAARLWPGQSAVGQLLALATEPKASSSLARVRRARVVGVSVNMPSGWIGIDVKSPAVYYAASAESPGMSLLIRANDAPLAKERIDRALSDANPRAVHEIRPLADYLAIQTWPFKAFSWVSSFIGVIALVLTVIGIYGVLSYVVAQRTREIGIRMALGGGVEVVTAMVMKQVAMKALTGLAIGFVLALGVSRLFASLLYVVDTFDPAGYAIGIGVVLGGALIAALAPARRATRVSPAVALREE